MTAKQFKVVIPVAGEGTRLRPHTYTTPKALIPVAGKPIISHILDPLIELEPEEIIFVIGHLGDKVKKFIEENYGFKASFVHQDRLLGLGYAIYLALKDMNNTPLLVILGDTIAKMDLAGFVNQKGNKIGIKKVDDPRRFGIAITEKKKILAFEEKPGNPRSDLAIIGVYYFEKSSSLKTQLNKLVKLGKKTSGEIQLTDALEFMLKAGIQFNPFTVDGWFDCGTRETLLETNKVLLSEASEVVDYPGSVIIPPVYISPDAEIEESVIGPYVSISERAKVRRSIIKDSIIGCEARVEHSLLDYSLIGERAVVEGTYRKLDAGDSSRIGRS